MTRYVRSTMERVRHPPDEGRAAGEISPVSEAYEAPRLMPAGSLRDLLGKTSGSQDGNHRKRH